VRCSSCEPLLDRYVEGTLTPREMLAVSAHLRTCPHCESLLTELRVIDALLATTKPAELAPNFTFAVMAELKSTPMRKHRRLSVWAVLAFYVTGAWIASSGIFAALGGRAGYLGGLAHAFSQAGSQSFGALSAIATAFSPATPLLLAGAVGILLLDALLVAGAVMLYRSLRSEAV